MNKTTTYLILILGVFIFTRCGDVIDDDVPNNTDQQAIEYGTIRFDFPLTDKYGAGKCTNRIDLSISKTADSLYRKEYITCANVSDFQGSYTFLLTPGKYFYQAGKICNCRGDTCLWNGYPGGSQGTLWTMGWFEIEKTVTITELISFQK